MKFNFLTSIAAATALLFGISACTIEEATSTAEGTEQEFELTVALGQMTKSNTNPGDGTLVNRCIMEIYYNGSIYGERIVQPISNMQATFSTRLITGRDYTFVFWADCTDATTSDKYYNTSAGLENISLKTAAFVNNQDELDAFYGAYTRTISAAFTETFNLERPFGQINIFTTDLSSIPAGQLDNSTIEVTYKRAPTTFNAMTGAGSNPQNLDPQTAATLFSVTGTSATGQVSYDYIFTTDGTQQTMVGFTLYIDGAETYVADNIPVQRNYKTNVRGNFLTKTADITVSVVPDFETPDIEASAVNPAASIAVSAATPTSLSFTVTPNSDVTAWKYILQASTATAPASEADFASATEMTGTQTLDLSTDASSSALTTGTEYTLYVLPVNTSGANPVYGTIVSASATPNYTSYYDMYTNGASIEIVGTTYTAAELANTYGSNIYHITTANATSFTNVGTGLYFVDSDVQLSSIGGNTENVMIIGNDLNVRTTLTVSGSNHFRFNTATGTFIAKNIYFDGTGLTSGYMMTSNYDGNADYVAFDNCYFKLATNKAVTYLPVGTATRGLDKFAMTNCIYEADPDTNYTAPNASESRNRVILQTGGTRTNSTFESLTFSNNIFFCNDPDKACLKFKLFQGSTDVLTNVTVENNTFINVMGTSSSGPQAIVYSTADNGAMSVKNNIFWFNTLHQTFNVYYVNTGTEVTVNAQDNIAYESSANTNSYTFGLKQGSGTATGTITDITTAASNPFEGGTFNCSTGEFVPNASYSSYGAQR